jgi:glycosyltransferase involved in cell wall biosynthesis
MLTLSLIIPVYNEERHMKACLDAVASQSVMPDEVLVIDNNCTDNTIAIASRYDFVTVIKEKKQGLIHARNKGFNAATGDILGRIDADSVLHPNWVETVLDSFKSDQTLQGVTGLAETYLFRFARNYTPTTVSRSYLRFVEASYRVGMMWGANMAIRSSAWRVVKDSVCLDDKLVHEDQDISCCFSIFDLKIKRNNNMLMRSDDDSLTYLPKFIEYDKRRMRTKKLHKSTGSTCRAKRTINDPFRIVHGLILGNVFRGYFWIAGSCILLLKRLRSLLQLDK